MSQEPWKLSAAELAGAIRAGRLSSRAIVDAHLDRIATVNDAVNAVTRVFVDEARAAADAADARLAAGEPVGSLHGVPVTIKENIDVAGSPTTHGLVSLKDAVPEADAPAVGHLKAAGAIVIGRTNMPDYGLRWHTDNGLHGATLNPWNPSRTPGGSSGGEAAALATGMTPLGLGNDMGGSTRQPAICCGVAGLRPSTGRVSRTLSVDSADPPAFYEQVACVNGPMARRVADLRLALSVLQQPDPADPVWMPAAAAPEPEVLRVGLVIDPMMGSGNGVDEAVADATRRAGAALEDAGYAVEAVEAPLVAEAGEVIQRIGVAEIIGYLDDILDLMSPDAGAFLRNAARDDVPTLESYRDAIAERHRIAAVWSRLLDEYPLIVGPVSTMEAFPVGFDTESPETTWRVIRSLYFTEISNLVGLPSVAVPVSVTGGLPQGVQVIGRRFDDERCLDAAEAIERVADVETPIDPVSWRS